MECPAFVPDTERKTVDIRAEHAQEEDCEFAGAVEVPVANEKTLRGVLEAERMADAVL